MRQKISSFIPWVLVIILIGVIFYIANSKKPDQIVSVPGSVTSTPTKNIDPNTVEYKNTEFGFSFALPKSWEGHTIIEDKWEGYSNKETDPGQEISETGPIISVRHPDWDYKSPRQDIPIMVFTLAQWTKLSNDEFHIGASPVGPRELGRNTKYVFAVPARYNYAFLTGFEEVEEILNDKNSFHTF